jgi:hypothetical protein
MSLTGKVATATAPRPDPWSGPPRGLDIKVGARRHCAFSKPPLQTRTRLCRLSNRSLSARRIPAGKRRGQTVCPFPKEATHPRCCGEGYPDWPGRASNKEGESWTSIAGLSSEPIRRSCAMPLRSRRRGVTRRFAIWSVEHRLQLFPQKIRDQMPIRSLERDRQDTADMFQGCRLPIFEEAEEGFDGRRTVLGRRQ